ncbi:MAG: response regulator transcription factor [Nocardioides sp.]|nr:response regulator transcription factor [Nocardioides sp.]
MEPTPVRIAIVNDYEIVVAGIAAVLSPFSERITVVELDARRPVVSDVDVVLYDSFGQAQGQQIAVAEVLANTQAKLVVISWNTDHELVAASLRAGASGYVSKGVTGEELVEVLERVHAGDQVTPVASSGPEGDAFGRWPGELEGLSPRESEVLALICQGLSNQELTERAFIGMNTVKTYIRTLYRKIGVESRTQAVLWGIDHGFTPDRARYLQT